MDAGRQNGSQTAMRAFWRIWLFLGLARANRRAGACMLSGTCQRIHMCFPRCACVVKGRVVLRKVVCAICVCKFLVRMWAVISRGAQQPPAVFVLGQVPPFLAVPLILLFVWGFCMLVFNVFYFLGVFLFYFIYFFYF